jgi:hypothetical protein
MKLMFILIGISLNLGCEIPDGESVSVKQNVSRCFVSHAASLQGMSFAHPGIEY